MIFLSLFSLHLKWQYWLWNTLGLKVTGDASLIYCLVFLAAHQVNVNNVNVCQASRSPLFYQFMYLIPLKLTLVYGSLAEIYYHILSKREIIAKGIEYLEWHWWQNKWYQVPWICVGWLSTGKKFSNSNQTEENMKTLLE